MNVYLLDNLWPNKRALKAAGGLGLVIGSDKDFAATRIAYKLNLQGPALTVQTACSTSLVAVHLAGQSLLDHECDIALAGGASIDRRPARAPVRAEGGIFSPGRPLPGLRRGGRRHGRGRRRGRGRAQAARRTRCADGDTIHAVIAGSAVNNDGAPQGRLHRAQRRRARRR